LQAASLAKRAKTLWLGGRHSVTWPAQPLFVLTATVIPTATIRLRCRIGYSSARRPAAVAIVHETKASGLSIA
jgi:hypothetical protein